MIVVDTTVWSLALRRRRMTLNARELERIDELARLVDEGQAILIGAVRQEVLSGIRDAAQFLRLRTYLRFAHVEPQQTHDFDRAAHYANICRRRGIQGSAVDFLICAVARRLRAPIFTTDGDFTGYARHLLIALHQVPTDSS